MIKARTIRSRATRAGRAAIAATTAAKSATPTAEFPSYTTASIYSARPICRNIALLLLAILLVSIFLNAFGSPSKSILPAGLFARRLRRLLGSLFCGKFGLQPSSINRK